MTRKKLGVKAANHISNGIGYIILIIVSILWLFPFFYLLINSVRAESGGLVTYLWPKEFTLENYKLLFTDPAYPFMKWYLNTLLISTFTAVIQTIITLLTAYALSRMRFKLRKPLMQFMLIIGMFPGFLSMICIYRILQVLNIETSIFGLVLVYISGSMMGYYLCKGFFDTIPKSLDEAAMIDGASRQKIFWSVILPLSKPIVIYTILCAFIGPWGDFMMSNFLIGRASRPNWTVAIGMFEWLKPSLSGDYFTRFCAGGVVVSIVPTVLYFVMQRFYVEGITGGAVKG